MFYELIITSASRPHLLRKTLQSLWAGLSQRPIRVLIHNDEVFPDRGSEMGALIEEFRRLVPVWYENSNPPRGLGPALWRLLQEVTTEYVVYSQDDHVLVRPIPLTVPLAIMAKYGLNQIRFNKRTTMDKKGDFVKIESHYAVTPSEAGPFGAQAGAWPLCVADHWYFQTGLWRVEPIRDVVEWWTKRGPGEFSEHSEAKINQALNGQMREYGYPGLAEPELWADPAHRAETVKTFIWGGVNEPQFIEHIGTDPQDWALKRRRDN